jgi:hypothetical protein
MKRKMTKTTRTGTTMTRMMKTTTGMRTKWTKKKHRKHF